LLFLALAAAVASTPVQIPQGADLARTIAARDAEFFQAFFIACDTAKVGAMLTDDFEMYHDVGGLVTTSAAPFLTKHAQDCEAKKKPDAWRSRRVLVPESLEVWPVPGHGAIEQGTHLFYERQGDGPEKLAGRARFSHVWRLTPTGWRISRALSYAHGPGS
jgi:hypothetical protein